MAGKPDRGNSQGLVELVLPLEWLSRVGAGLVRGGGVRLGFSGRSPSVSILPPEQDPRDKAEPEKRGDVRLGDDFEFEVWFEPGF